MFGIKNKISAASLSERHRNAEAVRRKELSQWNPKPSQDRALKLAIHSASLRLENRLRLNRALGRNKGHHQQQHFNRAHTLIAA